MASGTNRISPSPEYDKLISSLADARRKRHISQRALCIKLGKPPTFVSKIERGERGLGIAELFELATALEIDALALLKEAFGGTQG